MSMAPSAAQRSNDIMGGGDFVSRISGQTHVDDGVSKTVI